MSEAQRAVGVVRVRGGRRAAESDSAATEEPLEVRLHGQPFAVIMRTPGADRELAAGFLLAERVIAGADDLGTIAHCTDPAAGHPENIIDVTLVNGSAAAVDRLLAAPRQGTTTGAGGGGGRGPVQLLAARRQVTTTASCGMCGRRTIESLAADVAPLRAGWSVPPAVIVALPAQLRARQAGFDETAGLHAAGLFTRDGRLLDVAEDVGRHNAVDKIVGRMLMREALPLSDHLLCVSGRTSFEIVQKALLAGIPILAAVSAPSSLAIELASEYGVTLA